VLGAVGGVGEGESDWDADEVNVTNVCEELGVVVGEFAESPGDIDVRVAKVGYGGLYDCGTRIEVEDEGCVY